MERILNLRESLPSAADARVRADAWLRARQVDNSHEVLVITGRGNQSPGGIGVIRQEILRLLAGLRRRGVVGAWREHTPGSFVVALAPMSALMDAGRRKRDEEVTVPTPCTPASLAALNPATVKLLRHLAIRNLELLGVADPREFLEDEMMRTFSAFASAVPESANRGQALREALARAIAEPDE